MHSLCANNVAIEKRDKNVNVLEELHEGFIDLMKVRRPHIPVANAPTRKDVPHLCRNIDPKGQTSLEGQLSAHNVRLGTLATSQSFALKHGRLVSSKDSKPQNKKTKA